MNLVINKASEISAFEQLVSQVRLLISNRCVKPDEQLPTVKELAVSLKLNYNTVAAAYRELERQGYVVQNRRAGTRVATTIPTDPSTTLLAHVTADMAQQLGALGADPGEIIKMLAAQLALGSRSKPLEVAVLARTPLEAAQTATRTQAILGDGYRCIPQTPNEYRSTDYHLSVVSPELVASLAPPPLPGTAPTPSTEMYSAAFPAGAD